MERKMILGIVAAISVILVVAILTPSGRKPESQPRFPWDITINESGQSTVFGLTLGRSTLGEFQQVLQSSGEVNLFVEKDDSLSYEAFFKRVFLSGIRADIVAVIEVDPETAQQMFDRGLRQELLGTGNRKVLLDEADKAELLGYPVQHFTYIPATNLDEELVRQRFGEPARIIKEAAADIAHWLYPERGLDIALSQEGKEVLQYVNPNRFDRILGMLEQLAKEDGGVADSAAVAEQP